MGMETGPAGMALVVAALMIAGCSEGPSDSAGTADSPPAAVTGEAAPAAAPQPVQPPVPDNLATNPETALAAMQGQWVSVEDPRSTLSVSGNQVTMGYTGDSERPAPMRLDFVSECEGRPISGPRLGFTLTEDDMVLCYTDLDVDADNLEYFYAPRGNRHAFRRP